MASDIRSLIERLRKIYFMGGDVLAGTTTVELDQLQNEAADALEAGEARLSAMNKWRSVALCFGEGLGSVGPDGYYEFSAEQWFKWAQETDSRFDTDRSAQAALERERAILYYKDKPVGVVTDIIDRLEKELAEERRKMEIAEENFVNMEVECSDWKKKFEAAREVARTTGHVCHTPNCKCGEEIDAEIAAKLAERMEKDK